MKKYAVVGTGNRGTLSYIVPMVKEYADCVDLVAVCDKNIKRARLASEFAGREIPAYDDFDKMMNEKKPDVVVVTTRDCDHAEYIIKALEFGCDVISEKPMTTDDDMCSRIIEAERRTGHKVTVTFNCRFFPFYVRIKEMLKSGVIGDVLSVHFEWLLDCYTVLTTSDVGTEKERTPVLFSFTSLLTTSTLLTGSSSRSPLR